MTTSAPHSPSTAPRSHDESALPQARQVAVSGRRIAVLRADPPAGSAAEVPVLLLHGVPETSACWRELLPELARDRTVLAPDLPGLGASEVRGPYDVRSVAASLVGLLVAELDGLTPPVESEETDANGEVDGLEAESVAQRVDIVGHDWGGSLALAVAAARPDLIRRVVVVSGPYRYVDVLHAWHIPLLGFIPPGVFAGAGRAMVRGMFRYAWKSGRPAADMVEKYAASYAPRARVRAMAGYYRAAVRRKKSDDSGPSVAPERSLVVWGTDDPSLPLPVAESVVRDLGKAADPATVRMVTVPGVGHWPLEEAPDVVVPLIVEFLRAV